MVSTPINELVLGYAWSWPTLESLHFLALCLLMGSLLIMDLRLIGFQRIIPLQRRARADAGRDRLVRVNLITGLGFLFGDPRTYTANWAFWAKMSLSCSPG